MADLLFQSIHSGDDREAEARILTLAMHAVIATMAVSQLQRSGHSLEKAWAIAMNAMAGQVLSLHPNASTAISEVVSVAKELGLAPTPEPVHEAPPEPAKITEVIQ